MSHNFFHEFSKYPIISRISTLTTHYYENKPLFEKLKLDSPMNFHEVSMTKISFLYVNFEKTNFSTFMSGLKCIAKCFEQLT